MAGLGSPDPSLELAFSYRSEEMVFGRGLCLSPSMEGARAARSVALLRFGGAVVFVSVNQVLVRPWACRLSGGPPCRAVGRLAAVARAMAIAKSDRRGCGASGPAIDGGSVQGCGGCLSLVMGMGVANVCWSGACRARGVRVRDFGCGWFLCMVALDVLVRLRRTRASR